MAVKHLTFSLSGTKFVGLAGLKNICLTTVEKLTLIKKYINVHLTYLMCIGDVFQTDELSTYLLSYEVKRKNNKFNYRYKRCMWHK